MTKSTIARKARRSATGAVAMGVAVAGLSLALGAQSAAGAAKAPRGGSATGAASALASTSEAVSPRFAGRARVREYRQTMPTYPFGDPNPIPVVGRIYPYFRFDGFSATSVPKEWKIVELENAYLRVLVTPEIGGKIWAAIDKKSGRPFIYYNHAVKFRDIAMRGPWTSGGIEANYGIIGHTPNVSTPVDYTTRTNADGSVSVITGALDLLTNTTWRVETRLAPDDASFTTTSTWYNGSSLEEPYYHWMTAGIPVKGRLQYVFPGTSQIGHDGERGEWPINTKRGRDVSWYDNNNFGGYKSYHVFGGEGDFFGAYYHDQDFGMARVAPRDEKPGQKIWIWGLSRQGMIWEDLLTDTDGQYSELQSGRLFNQSAEGSTFTPFKHRGYTPHLIDRWTERWMPVQGTKGFVTAAAAGALNVTRSGDHLVVAVSPVVALDDSLFVFANGARIGARKVVRGPMQPWTDSMRAPGVDLQAVRVTLGDHRIDWSGARSATALDRPLETPASFDWSSAYGLWLKGKELIRQREYDRAVPFLDSALLKEPHFVPALADRAALAVRSMQYTSARAYARRALAIDQYDGASNYYYALASRALGRTVDARDGFEIATQSAEWRQAAWTELARLWMAQRDERRALDYAAKVLRAEPGNMDALAMRAVADRRRGDLVSQRAPLATLDRTDPLSHFVRFERLLAVRAPNPGKALFAAVRAEMPAEALFELAAWYQGIGDDVSTKQLLEGVGDQPEALYWRAALLLPPAGDKDVAPAGDESRLLIERANALSPRFVFPHRPEVIAALERIVTRSDSWKPRYYLALGYWATGRVSEAAPLLVGRRNVPDYAPFYAVRASLPGRTLKDQIEDLAVAATVDSTEWRFGKLLTEKLVEAGDTARAVETASRYALRFPASYILGMTRVRALEAAQRYGEADAALSTLAILPYEGSAEGHALYREAKLMLAVDAMRGQRWDAAKALIAAARQWPERLGAGRPYDADVDERLEDWLAADIARRLGAPAAAAQLQTHPMPEAAGLAARVIARWRSIDR